MLIQKCRFLNQFSNIFVKSFLPFHFTVFELFKYFFQNLIFKMSFYSVVLKWTFWFPISKEVSIIILKTSNHSFFVQSYNLSIIFFDCVDAEEHYWFIFSFIWAEHNLSEKNAKYSDSSFTSLNIFSLNTSLRFRLCSKQDSVIILKDSNH